MFVRRSLINNVTIVFALSLSYKEANSGHCLIIASAFKQKRCMHNNELTYCSHEMFFQVGRCRSSYKVFSDLLRKQYTKQQNNGP